VLDIPSFPAAALRRQSGKFILRTSTIIFTMTIMVEIRTIATKGPKNKAEPEPVSLYSTNTCPTYRSIFRKKNLKKPIGKTDIEDALDRLTQEEARMVDA
jgi:hypothetical protein